MHSSDLKRHYLRIHPKKELIKKEIPVEPLIQPQPRSRNLEKVPNDLVLERLEKEKKAETGLPKDILGIIA